MAEQGGLQFAPQGPREQFDDWDQRPLQEASVDVDGGVASAIQPFYLQPNQLAYLKNANLDTLGVRKKRYGCLAVGAPGVSPSGLAGWVFDNQTRYLVGKWGNSIYKSTGNYVWIDTATDVSLAHVHHLFAQGRVIQSSVGTSAMFAAGVAPYSGATYPALCVVPEDGAATLQVSYCPRALAWWQGRLWLGNLSVPDFTPNTLLWSNILDGWDIDVTNYIEVAAAEGDEIMAIVPTRGTQSRLYIFKKNSVYALDVVWDGGSYIPSTENSLDTTNARLVLVSTDVGCVAPNTIVYSSGSGESDIFFLAADGFRSLRRVEQDVAGGAGEAISEPIRDVMDRVNWAHAHRACATVYDHKVFLSLPVDGSTENNVTVVFDLTQKIWAGEYAWAVRDSALFNLSDSAEKLYLQWRHQTTETLTGIGATSVAHVFEALNSGTYYDPSLTAVEYEEHTRAFTFQDYGRKKRWDWIELMLQPSTTDATLTLYAKVDELNWALIGAVDISPVLRYPVLPAKLPFEFEDKVPQFERAGLIDLPPGQKIQIKIISDSPSDFGLRVVRLSAWPYEENWE